MSRLADIEFTGHDACTVARLSGEIDQSNVGTLDETLTQAVTNQSHALVLDLTDVTYFDSSGIQLVYELRAKLQARGQGLRLVIPTSSSAYAALRLAGVARHVELYESEEEALNGAAE